MKQRTILKIKCLIGMTRAETCWKQDDKPCTMYSTCILHFETFTCTAPIHDEQEADIKKINKCLKQNFIFSCF